MHLLLKVNQGLQSYLISSRETSPCFSILGGQKPFENFNKSECIEVIDKDFKIVHDIPEVVLVEIDAVEPSNNFSSSSVSTDNTSNIRLYIHPDHHVELKSLSMTT